MRKLSVLIWGAAFALGVNAYLPPVETRMGVKVEIESFPQRIDRSAQNPFSWPLGVTEVSAGAPRKFPVTLENQTDQPVSGTLEVWMNDDWTVTGEQGGLTLGAKERKTLVFTGTSKPSALNALYPVHARFTPVGRTKDESPHPIAVFRYRNPQTPNTVVKPAPPVLEKGEFRLDRGFVRTTCVQVNGRVSQLPESGAAKEWGGGMTKGSPHTCGVAKRGFNTHPPFLKGAGVLWSDFPLALPDEKPIRISFSNFLVSSGDQPPSDGVEYKVFVLEEGAAPVEVCGQLLKKVRTWSDCAGDLSAWAGKKIVLRLWTGPGPNMDPSCDGGGWGDVKLAIGPCPSSPTEADWQAHTARAIAVARSAREGTAVENGWRLASDDAIYGAGVAFGARGLIDGVLAFTDGERTVAFRGFTADVETGDYNVAPEPKAKIWAERGTLRMAWSIPGHPRGAKGFPHLELISVGPSSERPLRVYAGFGNVIEGPKRFTLNQSGFALSTRHVGADYANGLSVVQAVDVPPDRLVCDGERNLIALQAHHDATFTFVPSSKGSFAAARRFRAVAGYRKSPGHDRLGARMCLDQWSGNYAQDAEGLAKAAKYGLSDAIFVKHSWQRWGYDYRLPEIYPPRGDAAAFGAMREACRAGGILFCPHDNYTDVYPDCDGYSYDLVVFNLDGTPQQAWFNPSRHALSYRWAPHAFHPWCLRNARLLKSGYDPDAVFIDVLTAQGPFDYLDRKGNFHTKMETSANWAKGFESYREGFRRPDTVCVSEAGQDHLVGCADAGQSDHYCAAKVVGGGNFADAERTPWHDIVTHNYYVLFAGGIGERYQEETRQKEGDAELHGYASDDYLSNCIIGGRNPMCDGPFSRNAVKTYWMQHDPCAELGAAEFIDLRYEGSIHRQHSFFSDGSEVWINRATNATWTLPSGVVLPEYGYYAKTPRTESGVTLKNGIRCGWSKCGETAFYDARRPAKDHGVAALSRALRAEVKGRNVIRVMVEWETLRGLTGYQPFVHVCDPKGEHEGIVFHGSMGMTQQVFGTPGRYEVPIELVVPDGVAAGTYQVRYGAWSPKGGGRLDIGGGSKAGGGRTKGGLVTVTKADGKVASVAWRSEEDPADAVVAERIRLLGQNLAGMKVDFGDVATDGSFRIKKDGKIWTLTPLPYSEGFTAELALPPGVTVAGVEAIAREAGAADPTWRQEDGRIVLSVDAKAFAYRIQFN